MFVVASLESSHRGKIQKRLPCHYNNNRFYNGKKVTSAFQSRYILLIQGRLRFRTSSTRVPQRIFDNRLSSLFFDELG